ncbi:MAG: ATP-binding protein [Myxococcota bacterium]|nr:ATP-binding protein [Myxococcota bacterium]
MAAKTEQRDIELLEDSFGELSFHSYLDEWPAARKSALVSGIVSGLVLYASALLHYAAQHPAEVPFISPAVLELQIHLSHGVLVLWALLALVSLAARGRFEEQAFFLHAPIQLFSISNAVFSYFFGTWTVPYGAVVLIGGVLASLPVFGRRPTLLGAGTWALTAITLTVLEQQGVIPYAPLFNDIPVVAGQLSPQYLVGIGSITVIGILLCGVLFLTAIHQLQTRDRDLRRNREWLLESLNELHQSHEAIRQVNAELEVRVEDRVADLRTANEKLTVEVSERQKAVDEIDRLRLAMEAAIEGVAQVDSEGRFTEINAAFAAMYHSDPKTMMGTLADDWIAPEGRDAVAAAVAQLELGNKRELTSHGLRLDGSRFSVELSLVGGPNGGSSEHHRFARDITEQEALTAKLNHATKMEAIGRLAGGIAHDFNNLLTAILSASEQLESRFQDSAEHGDALKLASTSRMAGTRAAELTRQLLDFAHLKPSRDEVIDVHESIENSVRLLRSALNASTRLTTHLAPETLLTRGDAARFESGLLNLGLNARDAMPDGGELTISTSKVRLLPQEFGSAETNSTPIDFVRVDITDTGIGIEEENLTKIFEPFFTTKPPGQGTGLGLSVFDRYLDEIGGSLEVESKPGEGTVCSIHAPLSMQVDNPETVRENYRSLEGGEVLLIAEDDERVMTVISMLLKTAGYSVIPCKDGGEAVKAFADNHEQVAAALLDFRMPVMNGAEVFREFQEIDPSVPVVLMSGNLSDPDLDELKAQGLNGVVSKPCTRKNLLSALREALETAPKAP